MLRRLFFVTLLSLAACESPPAEEDRPPPAQGSSATESVPQPDSRPVIVAFGDSLTAGYGVPAGMSYPDFLQRKLDAAGYKYRVVNEGVSGDTSSAAVVRVDSVLAHNPKIVIVAFGGNDGLRGLSVESLEDNLREIITLLQQAGAEVVLGGMTLPPNYGRDYVRQFEGVYPRLAEELDARLVPFLLAGLAARPQLLADEIHPNAEGNEIVAGVVMKVLEPLLEKQ